MLQRIHLPAPSEFPANSPRAEALIVEAERRVDHFVHQRQGRLIHGFVASDFRLVDGCLGWIAERRLAPGRSFCEWGSGLGVITMLAALHDLNACGIEVEAELVDEARRLSDDFQIPAEFAHGSLIPSQGKRTRQYLDELARLDELSHIDTESPDGYQELGLELDDFDLVFAFPWPGESRFCEKLFDRWAAVGSLLLTNHGGEGLKLQRRVR